MSESGYSLETIQFLCSHLFHLPQLKMRTRQQNNHPEPASSSLSPQNPVSRMVDITAPAASATLSENFYEQELLRTTSNVSSISFSNSIFLISQATSHYKICGNYGAPKHDELNPSSHRRRARSPLQLQSRRQRTNQRFVLNPSPTAH